MSAGTKAKKAGSAVLNAANIVFISAHNASREQRIKEIDEEMKKLEEERARLVDELISQD